MIGHTNALDRANLIGEKREAHSMDLKNIPGEVENPSTHVDDSRRVIIYDPCLASLSCTRAKQR
jgi:hypothetical protein